MEPFNRKIQIYRLRVFQKCRFDGSWPAPEKHRFYLYPQDELIVDIEGGVKYDREALVSQMRVLDTVQKRPDINYLMIYFSDLVHCEEWAKKVEELVNLNDRSWTIRLLWHFPNADRAFRHVSNAKLMCALSILRNVEYFDMNIYYRGFNDALLSRIFRASPHFKKLKVFRVGHCTLEHLKFLFREASFADKLSEVRPQLMFDNGYSKHIFPGDIVSRIHTLTLGKNSSVPIAAVVKLPCLKTLHIDLNDTNEGDMVRDMPLWALFRWLEDPQCPVTELALEPVLPCLWPMILAVLPKIPKLQKIHLEIDWYDFLPSNLERLFPVLLETQLVHLVSLGGKSFPEHFLFTISEFQRHCRPLVFSFGSRGLVDCPGLELVHFTSWIYQTTHNFEGSKRLDPPLPLSTWANVLEKLGIAFDCRFTVVKFLGRDALFTLIQELFEDPLRFVDYDVCCRDISIAARVKSKRRRLGYK